MRTLLILALSIGALASIASAGPMAPHSARIITHGRVVALAADGKRAVFAVSGRQRSRIVVWEPRQQRITPIQTISNRDCSRGCGPGGGLAIAGTRVAWDAYNGGNYLETTVGAATLARQRAVSLGAGSWDWLMGSGGNEAFGPTGDGNLIAFTVQVHCGDPEAESEPPCPPGRQVDDVVSATVWRAARHGKCPSYADYRPLGHCARVAKANGKLTVLAVDAGRIAAQTDHGVRLLTAGGRRLLDLPAADVRAASLSGNRLALRVPGAFEIYDAGSGELVKSFPAEGSARLDRLEDLERGILVTAMQNTVTLRRLGDGRTVTFQAPGRAYAQLEPPGLFLAGGPRVTFTPMPDVLKRFPDGTGKWPS